MVWGNGVADALEHRAHLEGASRVVADAAASDWLQRMNHAADRLAVDWPATRALRAIVEADEQEPASAT